MITTKYRRQSAPWALLFTLTFGALMTSTQGEAPTTRTPQHQYEQEYASESLAQIQQQLHELASAVQELQSQKQGWSSKETLMIEEQRNLRQNLEQCQADLTNMEHRVEFLESEVNIIPFLQSEVTDLQEQDRLMVQEITSVARTCQACKGVGPLKRKVASLTNSVNGLSEAVERQLPEMKSEIEILNTGVDKVTDLEGDMAELELSVERVLTQLKNVSQQVEALAKQKEQKQILLKPLVFCPDGYQKVGSMCLQLVEKPMSWESAQSHCHDLGIKAGGRGELAAPDDMPEFREHVRALESSSNYLWLGGHRDEVSGWQWTNEDAVWPAETLPWDIGEPDNRPNQIHLCIKSHSNLKFHDCQNSALLGSICQIF